MNQNEKQMLVQGITLLETTLSQEVTSAKAGPNRPGGCQHPQNDMTRTNQPRQSVATSQFSAAPWNSYFILWL
jgi:hypothetical protein